MLSSKEAVEWEMRRAMAKSKTLKEMPAVGKEWVEKWIRGWMSKIKS